MGEETSYWLKKIKQGVAETLEKGYRIDERKKKLELKEGVVRSGVQGFTTMVERSYLKCIRKQRVSSRKPQKSLVSPVLQPELSL